MLRDQSCQLRAMLLPGMNKKEMYRRRIRARRHHFYDDRPSIHLPAQDYPLELFTEWTAPENPDHDGVAGVTEMLRWPLDEAGKIVEKGGFELIFFGHGRIGRARCAVRKEQQGAPGGALEDGA